jgi:hypothetical protein
MPVPKPVRERRVSEYHNHAKRNREPDQGRHGLRRQDSTNHFGQMLHDTILFITARRGFQVKAKCGSSALLACNHEFADEPEKQEPHHSYPI